MRIIPTLLIAGLGLSTAPAMAQSFQPQANTIMVVARAAVETPPDTAVLTVTARGEGKTPDAATRALADKLKAITSGLRTIDDTLEVQTGSMAVGEAFAGECNRDSNLPLGLDAQMEMAADALSVEADKIASGRGSNPAKPPANPCAVVGYIARSDATIKIHKTKDAGTAVGLASRLGASNAGLESFDLAKTDDARSRATAAAIANARGQAQAIAAGSGVKLGPIVSVIDGSDQGGSLKVAEMLRTTTAFDSMAASAPPIPVEISPKPVTTSAQLMVTFAVSR